MKGKKAIFVDPTNKTAVANALKRLSVAANVTYGGGSDGNPLGSSTPWCQLYIDPSNYDKPPKKSYPIVGPTYLMFYGQNNGVHVSDKIALIKFLMSLGFEQDRWEIGVRAAIFVTGDGGRQCSRRKRQPVCLPPIVNDATVYARRSNAARVNPF